MQHITSLRTYPDMRQAISAIDDLHALYLKAHKRNTDVELTVSSLVSPFDRSKRRSFIGDEPVETRVKFLTGQEKQAEWFVAASAARKEGATK